MILAFEDGFKRLKTTMYVVIARIVVMMAKPSSPVPNIELIAHKDYEIVGVSAFYAM